jgi:Zc3h12a-like Ribonuclease NYN domain
MLFLPLAEAKTIAVASRSAMTEIPPYIVVALALAFVVTGVVMALLKSRQPPGRRRSRGQRRTGRPKGPPRTGRTQRLKPPEEKNVILVDGSNVMHWLDEKPQLAPLVQVIRSLQAQGYKPGVVFDANAGHMLVGRYLNEGDFATMLSLPRSQVLVVPRGTQADPFLLDSANEFGARIVTNDRFRDWAEAHPKVLENGFLIRGGCGRGRSG